MPENIIQIDQNLLETRLDRLITEKMTQILNAMLDAEVVPEKLRTLDHGRPWSDDQFASTRLSSSRDMSR